MPRTITRVVVCTDGGEFLHPGLANAPDKAAWFRQEYDEAFRDWPCDVAEFQPLGRFNRPDGQWAWPKRSEFRGPYWKGWCDFLDTLDWNVRRRTVRASFGCPRHLTYGGFARDMARILIESNAQFDDIGTRAAKVCGWLARYDHPGAVLETVPTDSIQAPKLATRFAVPQHYENWCTWQFRASVAAYWCERSENPANLILSPFDGANPRLALSLYLPARDCQPTPNKPYIPYMTVERLNRIAPHLTNITLQGPIPAEHLEAVRSWRAAGPVQNTEGGR